MNMQQIDYPPSYCTMYQDETLNFLVLYWNENYKDVPAGTVMVTYHPTCGIGQTLQEHNPSFSHLMVL